MREPPTFSHSMAERSDNTSNPMPSEPRVSEAASAQRMPSTQDAELGEPSPGPSSVSGSEMEEGQSGSKNQRGRPPLGSRHSSKNIVPRDQPIIELKDEKYSPNDARSMSPRRTSEEVDRLEENARQALIEQAKALQATLLSIIDRVESVKSEHEKLEGGNKFLQSYIGELMQTSKLTAAGATKGKGKARSGR